VLNKEEISLYVMIILKILWRQPARARSARALCLYRL